MHWYHDTGKRLEIVIQLQCTDRLCKSIPRSEKCTGTNNKDKDEGIKCKSKIKEEEKVYGETL